VCLAISPVIIIPFMLFGGFFLNSAYVSDIAKVSTQT
jgi:hypothetical protein